MNEAMDAYLDHIRANYKSWRRESLSKFFETNNINWRRKAELDQEIQDDEQIKEFCDGLVIEPGSKYLKVVSGRAGGGRSVHSFVCLKDSGKFKKGDILKAASWAAPARNFARGNVLEGNFGSVTWTGA